MRIADVLPLTPLQQGLLFHAITAQSDRDDVYAVQLNITLSGPLDSDRLGQAVQAVVTRHPNLVARFSQKFAEPMQIIPADPVAPWQYVDLTDTDLTAVASVTQIRELSLSGLELPDDRLPQLQAFAHLNARERQLKNEWVEQIGRGTGASATVPPSGGV